jgi:hypothetical protein
MQQRGVRTACKHFSAAGGLACALALAGCWEGQPRPQADPRLVEQVQVSRREPLGCWPLGAVDGNGAEAPGDVVDYQAAYDAVRIKAALRGANLVVIDAVGQPRMLTHSMAVYDYTIAGRLFRCPAQHEDAPARDETPPSGESSCGGQCCPAQD